MAQLKKPARIKCMGCGKSVLVKEISTVGPDPDGKTFDLIKEGLKKMALCPDCQGRYNYLASVGRSDLFHFIQEDLNG